MAETTVLARSSFIRGNVSGSGDLEIAGRIEGDVTVTGEVVIESTGLVGANVSATRIVVRGAVRGDLVAEESLVVESGARIQGALRAPRIAIAPGGLVRGHVETGGAKGQRPRAAAVPARAATPVRTAAPAPAPAKVVAKPAPPPVAKAAPPKAPPGSTLAGAKPAGPPPPVVPVLKKGTKAVQKKRG